MALPLSHLPNEILRELRDRKWAALIMFVLVSFAVLGAGFFFPYKYKSEVVIFVDDRNIIGPLMEGRAVTTKINDRASAAQELLMTRNVIEKIARDPSVFPNASMTPASIEQRIARVRGGLFVQPRGDSYFSIGFSADSQVESFYVAQRLGQLFIAESNQRKRTESQSAYDFIDKQVKSYEIQLAEVENSLRLFLSENTDGTEAEANARLAQLRNQLELAKLEKEELMARVGSLQNQLSGVSQTVARGKTEDGYRERIRALEERLDSLRLQYHDTYPDIVILREQIAELRKQRAKNLGARERVDTVPEQEGAVNPVFQELSGVLSEARANVATANTRISSLERLIQQQNDRMERIQENKAQYSELTRDMEVNREIYDDLLKRREKARVSMHLDIEGQGLTTESMNRLNSPTSHLGPGSLTLRQLACFSGYWRRSGRSLVFCRLIRESVPKSSWKTISVCRC